MREINTKICCANFGVYLPPGGGAAELKNGKKFNLHCTKYLNSLKSEIFFEKNLSIKKRSVYICIRF
jgi:hypothetical protein